MSLRSNLVKAGMFCPRFGSSLGVETFSAFRLPPVIILPEVNFMENQEIKISIDEKTAGGVYSNIAAIFHTENEFVTDFMFVHPPAGKVNSRIIMSPAHMKKFMAAMQQNIAAYEAKFGRIKDIPDQPDFRINLSPSAN